MYHSTGEEIPNDQSVVDTDLNNYYYMSENGIFEIPVNTNISGNLTNILDDYRKNLFTYNKFSNIILISTYIPLFIIALTSNILVILVVSRFRCLRSVTNYFLVNLSIADLLVTLICMPLAVGKATHSLWLYGEFFCKFGHYLTGVAVGSSVFTITAMSVDRYLAIRHPMSRKIINRRTTRKVILILWIVAVLIFAPIFFIRKSIGFRLDGQDFLYCIEDWPSQLSRRTFGIFCFIFVYAVPGLIVVLAYSLMGLRLCQRHLLPEYQMNGGIEGQSPTSRDLNHCDSINSTWQVSSAGGRLIRERRRVAKILLILAIVFSICWAPYSVLSLILDLKSESRDHSTTEDQILFYEGDGNLNGSNVNNGGGYDQPAHNQGPSFTTEQINPTFENTLLPFAILLGHANSAINPILYLLLSKNFRRSVNDLLRHPAKLFRSSRQQCKIRMNFRKEPPAPISLEPPHSSKEISRRNHHAPEPPAESPPQFSGGNRSPRIEPNEIVVDLEIIEIPLHNNNGSNGNASNGNASNGNGSSPVQSVSSGYSSTIGSNNSNLYYPHACTEAGSIQSLSISTSSGNGNISNNFVAKENFGNCVCGGQMRRCRVPSTIREESDSYHSHSGIYNNLSKNTQSKDRLYSHSPKV